MVLLDWILLLTPQKTRLLVHRQKNTSNKPYVSIEPAPLFLSLASLSSMGFPISVQRGNALGFFELSMQYISMGFYNRLIIDILTRLSWALAMWGWGGYLPAELLNNSTLLSWFSTLEWPGFLK
jgi:hypothetical protein